MDWIELLKLVDSHPPKIAKHVYLGISHLQTNAHSDQRAQITIANGSATAVNDVIHRTVAWERLKKAEQGQWAGAR
jgi:hypothetical protein